MSNVVKLEDQRKPSYTRIKNGEAAMTELRKRMYGEDLHTMANYVGVSVSCLYAIRAGRTKWPRETTIFCLMEALDLEMYFRSKK